MEDINYFKLILANINSWNDFNQNQSQVCNNAINTLLLTRDQPNSREKVRDFMVEFVKCAKFHGKFTEGVWEIHGPHSRYFEVLC